MATPVPFARPPIRVLVVDDSAVMRQVLARTLGETRGIEVCGRAGDVAAAAGMVRSLLPDVVTLDVEMPGMGGLEFLEKLMKARPTPVVMVSSFTKPGCDATLRALELGAIDFVEKPSLADAGGVEAFARSLGTKVKVAAKAHATLGVTATAAAALPGRARPATDTARASHQLVAIGASTGGPSAIARVLASIPPDAPGIVIAQHMPAAYTLSFAERLDATCAVRVALATTGAKVRQGWVLLAPGDEHVNIERDGATFKVRCERAAEGDLYKPSVDRLFESAAIAAGARAVGVLLTGMGDDGARGLLAMRRAGAHAIAQDAATCVVFGMPRAAIELGAATCVLPLDGVARGIMERVETRQRAGAHR